MQPIELNGEFESSIQKPPELKKRMDRDDETMRCAQMTKNEEDRVTMELDCSDTILCNEEWRRRSLL